LVTAAVFHRALSEDGRTLTIDYVLEDPDYRAAPASGIRTWRYTPDLNFILNQCDLETARRYVDANDLRNQAFRETARSCRRIATAHSVPALNSRRHSIRLCGQWLFANPLELPVQLNGDKTMISRRGLLATTLFALSTTALSQEVEDFSPTIETFRQIPQVAPYFDSCYGFAVWRTIARGGIGIGGATGRGQVYVNGQVTGFSRLIDISIGFQLGGQAYRQIIFFENEASYIEFTRGNFEFDAQASAVAVTASAQASSGTQGSQATAGASGTASAAAGGRYQNGMRIFTVATGGLMYQATIAGQKYNFTPVP